MTPNIKSLSRPSRGGNFSAWLSQGILLDRSKNRALVGIELGRGLAIFAVILDHAGDETWRIPVTQNAVILRSMLHFAVPFFLATAFYFMTSNIVVHASSFWQSRLKRTLIPYVIWSCIFLISRVIIFTLSNKPGRLQELLDNPLSIIFLGGASYHLYFLPLLITGTLLMSLTKFIRKQNINTLSLSIYLLISIFVYHVFNSFVNQFFLVDVYQKEIPISKIFLVESSWVLRCLPYFFAALILEKKVKTTKTIENKRGIIAGLFILFLLINTLGSFIPRDVKEPILAYLLLLCCILSSGYLRSDIASKLANSIGLCSYGIYLIHPFIINFVKLCLNKLTPQITDSVSMYSILLLSTWSLLISWILVSYIVKQKSISKYLFGTF